MGRAFVSYVREDLQDVEALVEGLRKRGADIWFDRENLLPGQVWPTTIGQAISAGDYFLACFSSQSVGKPKSHMHREVLQAVEELQRRPAESIWFIPVKLDRCTVPELPIGGGRTLRDLHWVELYDDWTVGLERIAAVICPPQVVEMVHPEIWAAFLHSQMGHLHSLGLGLSILNERDLAPNDRRQLTEQLRAVVLQAYYSLENQRVAAGGASKATGVGAQRFDLREVLRRSLAAMRDAQRGQVDVVATGFEALPASVVGDQAAVALAVHNLLENAVRHAPFGRSVATPARPQVIVDASGSTSQKAVLGFEGPGPGIAESEVEHLFDLGYRGAASRGMSYAGMGTSLFTAKRVATMYGGSLEYERGKNAAHRFVLSIPADSAGSGRAGPSS